MINKCAYCQENIPEGRYIIYHKFKTHKSLYCCSEHQGRATTLRMGLKRKELMPKNLDETDKNYLNNQYTE